MKHIVWKVVFPELGASGLYPAYTAGFRIGIGKLDKPASVAVMTDLYGRDVGFLKYWTLSNLPLFLLALPLLIILGRSSLWALRLPFIEHQQGKSASAVDSPAASLLTQLGVAQGLLAVMAFTSYHVQIINRISSGYPVWYWYLASQLLDHFGKTKPHKSSKTPLQDGRISSIIVQSMIIYGLIQAVLFGSFLPPA